MTTFTTLSASDYDSDSPITVNLATAWYENPLAIAEDDATAPAFKGRIKAVNLITAFPHAGYVIASGQALIAVARLLVSWSSGSPPYTATITVAIKHNGTTLKSETITLSSTGAGSSDSFVILAYSTTVATGDLTVTATASGGNPPGTVTVSGSLLAVKIVAP